MSFTGTPSSGPQRVGVAIGDLTSGMWTALGILAAVLQRQQTGLGQRVETSLLASLISLLSVQGQRYLTLGEVPQPVGNVHPVIAPYGVFEAQDGPLNIGAATQDQWLKLARLLELEHLLDDPRFVDNAQRMRYSLQLKELLEVRLAQRTRAEWTAAMVAAGIPAGPINNLAEVFAEAQVHECGLVEEFDHPTLGRMRQVANPLRMDGLRGGSVRLAPPLFGQHTREVLRGFGYAEESVERWIEEGVVMDGLARAELAPVAPAEDAGASEAVGAQGDRPEAEALRQDLPSHPLHGTRQHDGQLLQGVLRGPGGGQGEFEGTQVIRPEVRSDENQ